MTSGKGKRLRDPNQIAKWIAKQPTAPVSDKPFPIPSDLWAHMAAMSRKGVMVGGAFGDDDPSGTRESGTYGCSIAME